MRTVSRAVALEEYRDAKTDVLGPVIRELLKKLPNADTLQVTVIDFGAERRDRED